MSAGIGGIGIGLDIPVKQWRNDYGDAYLVVVFVLLLMYL
jgi:hypothetical protein